MFEFKYKFAQERYDDLLDQEESLENQLYSIREEMKKVLQENETL
jgi:hypothetical protein